MKRIILVLLVTFLMAVPVYADNFQDGLDADARGDYKEAVRLYRLSAEQGHVSAQYNLGVMSGRGQGVPQDLKEEVRWYRLSAEQGHAKAQYNLGLMYDNGQGIPQDYKEAAKWYRLSAERGHRSAQYNLGMMSGRGEGVPQDFQEVVRLLRLAAEQEHVNAQYNLGVMHRHGLGIPRDYVLAHMWWSISGFNGDEESVENKNKVEKRMTPLQIEKAKDLARNWKPTSK